MKKVTGLVFLLLFVAVTPHVMAQYQSCVYCDVVALDPDPFPVYPCDVMTIIVNGDGYQTPSVNGCDVVPVVDVRSRRPDRILIVAFRIIDDDTIEVDIEVPCDASPGLVGIDVLIDDYTSDAIPAYACGNLRMEVLPVQSCVYCDLFSIEPDPLEVEPCDTGTVTITGEGFSDPSLNDCIVPPVVDVISTNPSRLRILAFRVLDDGTIEVDYEVPCDAPDGNVRIVVLIDDDPNDTADPLECGRARISVLPRETCNYCDVEVFTPNPYPLRQCESTTLIINGEGFLDTNINNCDVPPIVNVISLDPGNLIILDYRVLDDGTIEVDVQVPCDADIGSVRIQIIIDEDPDDNIDPVDCGQVNGDIRPIPTTINLISFGARQTGAVVGIRWETGSERNTLFFDVYRTPIAGGDDVKVNDRPIFAEGTGWQGAIYTLEEAFDPGWGAVQYYLIETEVNGTQGRYGPVPLLTRGAQTVSRSRARTR